MRAPRLVLAAIVLGTIAVTGAGAAVGAAPQTVCGGRVADAGHGWRAIRPPFPSGQQKVTQLLATPFVPDRMYATNGSDLMLTEDAGCRWIGVVIPKAGTVLGDLPDPVAKVLTIPTTTSITAVSAPSSATISDRVYVGLEDSSLLTNSVRMGYYDGNTWHFDASGLPSTGRIADITASPTAPTIAYAMVDATSALDQKPGLYATRDGGKTWALRNAGVSSSDLTQLRVDPNVPTLVYALGGNGIQVSNDGGATFTPGTKQGSDIASYDVADGGGSARIVQGHTSKPFFDESRDAGLSWRTLPSLVDAKEVAMQPLLDQVAVSDGKLLMLVQPALAPKSGTTHCHSSGSSRSCSGSATATGGYAQIVTPGVGAPVQVQFTAPTAAGFSIVGVHGDVILRAVFSLKNSPIIGKGLTPIILLPQVLPHQFPSTLLPGTATVSLPPGAHRDVSYQLLLPRTPSPIDVMFLIDTTDSTRPTIDGLRGDLTDIVNSLATVGLDVEFGVADFRDYAPSVENRGDGAPGDYPYRLDARIGRVSAALRLALSRLQSGGGGDPPEADLTALYQSTTGVGQHFGKRVVVPPGRQAGYRPGALKLAVIATDAAFHGERDYLTPRWSTTVSALLAYGVHPIGLNVQGVNPQGNPQGFPATRDEARLATATYSFAPRGGVDCNGDLRIDVPAGAPFVCKVPLVKTSTAQVGTVAVGSKTQPVKLTPAITTAAESLADFRTVGLSFSGHRGIARVVGPSPLPRVNLRSDNTVDFTVRYTCPTSHTSHVYPLGVSAGTAGRVFASSAVSVACGAVPVPQHPVVPPAAAAVIPPAAAAAAPPAPGNPVPNTNPNPNPALNGNVGFASQQEEQRQLAFADADAGIQEDTSNELAMSRLGAGAAVLLMAAAGYAARHRVAAAWHRR